MSEKTITRLFLCLASGISLSALTALGQEQPLAVKPGPADGWRSEVISSARIVKGDLAVPQNVCLTFEDGGVCDVQEGATLTINGPLDAPAARIFRGTGRVVFGPNFAQRVCPQWWGARADDGADDTAALQAALDSLYTGLPQTGMLPPGGGTVYLAPGRYEITSRLTFFNGLNLEGSPLKTILYAARPLQAMLQRPDLTPPPDDIHFNRATRIDGVRIANLILDGGPQDSVIGLDLTNTNYSVIENVSVIHCKTGVMMAQLGMYNTFNNVAVGLCDVGMECNIGVMDNNIFGGRFGSVRIGLLINNTGHLNLYGTTFESFSEAGIDIKSGSSVNLNNLWFDAVAPATVIKISSRAAGCSIIQPRFSGPTPKLIDNQSPDTLILDTISESPAGIRPAQTTAGGMRGQAVISGDAKAAAVKFPAPQADDRYFVTATTVAASGAPRAGARAVYIMDKSKEGFKICAQEAPGQGAAVTVDWILVR